MDFVLFNLANTYFFSIQCLPLLFTSSQLCLPPLTLASKLRVTENVLLVLDSSPRDLEITGNEVLILDSRSMRNYRGLFNIH